MPNAPLEEQLSTLRSISSEFGLSDHVDRIDDRVRDQSLGLVVMVVGEGKFGKSSLINQLVGEVVAPVAVVPKTFKIDIYLNSEKATPSAELRYRGQPKPLTCSIEEAKQKCADEELKVRTEGSDLVEATWRYPGLHLGPNLALVDTPGLAQSLVAKAKAKSLVEVLGANYTIEDVWAYWFHRADLVMWAFAANKLEAKETQEALTSALKLFRKPIIPVATKADTVGLDRIPELTDRFQQLYGVLLKAHAVSPLLPVVVGGASENVGYGVQKLMETVQSHEANALKEKTASTEKFAFDEAKQLRTILKITAEKTVENVRAIAEIGDALALDARKFVEDAATQAKTSVLNYVSERELSSAYASMLERLLPQVNSCSKSAVNGLIQEGVDSIISKTEIQKLVRGAFMLAAERLTASANRRASTVSLQIPSFSASGKTTIKGIRMPFDIEEKAYSLALSQPQFFTYATGLASVLEAIVDFLFGGKRFSSSYELRVKIGGELAKIPEGVIETRKFALYRIFLPSILQAVDAAIQATLNRDVDLTLAKLKEVDSSLNTLDRLYSKVISDESSFELWAKFWSSSNPGLDLAKKLSKRYYEKYVPTLRDTVEQVSPPSSNLVLDDLYVLLHSGVQFMISGSTFDKSNPKKNEFVTTKLSVCKFVWVIDTDLVLDRIRIKSIDSNTNYRQALQEKFHDKIQGAIAYTEIDLVLRRKIPVYQFPKSEKITVDILESYLKEAIKQVNVDPRVISLEGCRIGNLYLEGYSTLAWLFLFLFLIILSPIFFHGFFLICILLILFVISYSKINRTNRRFNDFLWKNVKEVAPNMAEQVAATALSYVSAWLTSDFVDQVVNQLVQVQVARELQALILEAGSRG